MADATTATPTMMTAAAAAPSERIEPRRLVAFLIMVFGMISMSILDIQIVSASLTDIQAGLSASSTEVSWVQTAYLIAEVIAIPLSGFLSRALGTRLLFAISAGGLHDIEFRLRLCLLDRADDPVARAAGISRRRHDPDRVRVRLYGVSRTKFYIVGPIIGLVATLAPTIGPTVGGYITDVLSWHWLFFINVIPGIGIIIGVLALVDFDEPNFELLDHFDWFGLIAMAGFLGSLEYVLEEGPQYEWLQDTSVAVCAAVAQRFRHRLLLSGADCGRADRRHPGLHQPEFRRWLHDLVLRRHRPLRPDLRLSALSRRRCAAIALLICESMFVSGATMFLMAPILGRLMLKVDMRYIIAAGLIIFGLGSYQMTWITRDYDFYELLVPQILRGIGMMFAMVPTNNIALGTLTPDRVKNASGLFNLTRNLGGAVGLAIINEILNDRTDLHISRLQDRVNWGNATATETLNMLTQRLQGMGDASLMALKQLSQIVHRQAVVMGYGDAFFILTVFYLGLSLSVILLKKPALLSSGGGGH